MTRPIRGVLFDLDGTLVNSWPAHARALRHAALAVGAGEMSGARLFQARRPTDIDTLLELVGAARLTAAHQAYEDTLCEELAAGSVALVPHACEVVTALRRLGTVVGVCTGRSRRTARALLDASGLRIPLTVAREDTARTKPAPDALRLALARLALAPEDALFVGDSEADASQGRAADVRTVIVGTAGLPTAIGDRSWLLDPGPLREEAECRKGPAALRIPRQKER